MARVPTYTQPTVEARPLGAPQLSASVPAGAFDTGGSALVDGGQKLAAMGDQLAAQASKLAEDDAQAAANQAMIAFKQTTQDMLFNRPDAYFRQEGQASYEAMSKVNPMLDEARQRLGSNLSGRARKIYDEHSSLALVNTMEPVLRRGLEQGEKWRDEMAVANVKLSLNEAALYWNDPDRRDASINAARNVLLQRNTEKKWAYDDPRNLAGLAQIESEGLFGSLMRAAEENPMAAKEEFDKVKHRMTADKVAALAPVIDQKAKLYRVDQEVARVKALPMTGGGDTANNPGNLMPGGQLAGFKTPEDGVAATVRNLQSYPDRFGASTLSAIAAKWAPAGPGDNDPAVWARNVGQMAGGIDPNAPLDLKDPDTLARLVPAIAKQEKGHGVAGRFSPAVVATGIEKALSGAPVETGGQSSRADELEFRRNAIMSNPNLKPDERQSALTRIEHDHAQENAILAQKEKEARRQADEMVRNGTPPDALPDDIRSHLGAEYMTHLDNRYRSGNKVQPNPTLENELHNQLVRDPAGFAARDLTKDLVKLPDESRHYWMNKQQAMVTSSGKEALRQPSYALGDKVVEELLKATGSDSEENLAVANQRMRAWLDSWHEENKKAPPSDEVYRFGKSMLLQDDSFFSQRRIDAIRQNKEASFVLKINRDTLPSVAEASGIPATDILPVSRYLKQKGMPVTLENLIMVHRAGTRQIPQQIAGEPR